MLFIFTNLLNYTFFQAIHGFREIEHKKWNSDNDKILQRVRDVAFDKKSVENVLEHVHVLDLSKDGKINPHVDSIRVRLGTLEYQ